MCTIVFLLLLGAFYFHPVLDFTKLHLFYKLLTFVLNPSDQSYRVKSIKTKSIMNIIISNLLFFF